MNYVPPSHACQDKVKSLDPRSSPFQKRFYVPGVTVYGNVLVA